MDFFDTCCFAGVMRAAAPKKCCFNRGVKIIYTMQKRGQSIKRKSGQQHLHPVKTARRHLLEANLRRPPLPATEEPKSDGVESAYRTHLVTSIPPVFKDNLALAITPSDYRWIRTVGKAGERQACPDSRRIPHRQYYLAQLTTRPRSPSPGPTDRSDGLSRS
jgi:hypothetical protein